MFIFKKRSVNTDNWTTQQWRDHLLSNATTESERQDIYAMFSRQA